MTWYPEIESALSQGNYDEVAQFYEQRDPESIAHYWYLGLVYLLQEKEEEAQTTWLLAMSEGNEEEIEAWTEQLITILDTEATRQKEQENSQLSWLIRGHIRAIEPNLLNNLLHLILLSIQINSYHPEQLKDWQVIEILREIPRNLINSNLLLEVLDKVLEFPDLITIEFAQESQKYLKEDEFVVVVQRVAIRMVYNQYKPDYAADLIQLCLEKQPNNLCLLNQGFWFNVMAKRNDESILMSKKIQEIGDRLSLKVYGKYQTIHVLIHQGDWLSLRELANEYSDDLRQMIENDSAPLNPLLKPSLQGMTLPLLYIQDNPQETRWLQNQLSRLLQENVTLEFNHSLAENDRRITRPLKIGYIAHTLRKHSIGWLSRWLLYHRNSEAFKVTLYLVNQPEDELTKNWFRNQADMTYNFERNPEKIAHQIQEDKIDILMDLDSITHATTCQVMALKPAPIQATWLGFDASGIPAIDYYIADPYVLPANAQEYYQEKIWRLPHTFLAVDGSEVGVPTLRREHLDIPSEATIYLSVQAGLKRHPDTIRLQMKIIKQVPNSYFIIQGPADEEIVKKLFTQIAEAEGVSSERLRFIPSYPTEIYRGNLAIADVVLDTYPFNGGTTTLDILWREIPVVTRVGKQWASRLGYSLLTNAGISEGIAWSDEEYIDWGVRLGMDENLRKKVIWSLKKGKKSAPLWNAKAFTQEMENAYKQMWEIYCQRV